MFFFKIKVFKTIDKYGNLKLRTEELSMITDIKDVLCLFYDATLNFSSNKYGNIGIVLPVYYALLAHLKD